MTKLKTSTAYKSKATNYEVTIIAEYTRVLNVVAVDEEEAKEIAENRTRAKTAVMTRLGYSIGDVEAIDAQEKEFIGFNYGYRSRTQKRKGTSPNTGVDDSL